MRRNSLINGDNGNTQSFLDRDESPEIPPVDEELSRACDCHNQDYPPWTGEIHGMSQALLSKSPKLRVFWWMVLFVCTSCGTATTILVIIEYIHGPTATSTTIRLVPSLKLPAITVCPKVPDAFDFDDLYDDIRTLIPEIEMESARDLVRFWLAGSGLENITPLIEFNRTYLDRLARWYDLWSNGYDQKLFFETIQAKYGYQCKDLFHYCEIGGKSKDCCADMFRPRAVMRRGLCHQTKEDVNQTEADDIGRLVLRIKAPPAVTSPQYSYTQPQIIIYVHEWNRMHFTARYVELLEHPNDCTSKIIGRDTACFVRNWLMANLIDPLNCTVPYLTNVPDLEPRNICDPFAIVKDYYNIIEVVHAGSVTAKECLPGCQRWEYQVSLQQSMALDSFVGYKFNLEASFYDLQYEHVKEVPTTSLPGFMSQIGGQFGFFLGLSIITMLQIVIYGVTSSIKFFYSLFKPTEIVPTDSSNMHNVSKRLDDDNMINICTCQEDDYLPPWTSEIHGLSQALQSKSRRLRLFWWFVLLVCTCCGSATTVLVVREYFVGQTATSTIIRLVNSLELPAITLCPKVADSFRFKGIYADMSEMIPGLENSTAIDLLRFWLGGSGFENIEMLKTFNRTYLDRLNRYFKQWSDGKDKLEFFNLMVKRYGYKCGELFYYCEISGKIKDCCDEMFRARSVMRRGLCYQTRRNVNQTESDDIGKLLVLMKAPHSATYAQYDYTQPQIVVYVNDNYEQVLDFPRFYLYPDNWNRMHFTARYVELLEHPKDCSPKITGKDAGCYVRNWITANIVVPFNCTLPYLHDVPGVNTENICDPYVIASDYDNTIVTVHSGVPGCKRWDYTISLQQSMALDPFAKYRFNLEASFYDLQYEHVKEVATTSVPGFMSQIGGQFGFFLGLSIITVIQMIIYAASSIFRFIFKISRPFSPQRTNNENGNIRLERLI
ncbi:Na+ channel, amiloride-sensitive family-containing protein [Aphelenchoides besseyi]|nr:Na+ channel, amiloride-sensitive family-containing protein [Aphelenchoides besseyi]